MNYVTISVEEYNNAVEKGLDIVSYMQGRMDEAKADVKVIPEPINIQIDGVTFAKAAVPASKELSPLEIINLRMDTLTEDVSKTATTVAELAQSAKTKAAKGLTGIFKEAYRKDYSLVVNGNMFHVGDRVRFGEGDEPWVIDEIDLGCSTSMPVLLRRGNASQWPDYDDLEDMKLVKKP